MLLSSKGIVSLGDGSTAKLRICNECHGDVQKLSLPKFSIRNGFYIGNLDNNLSNSTIVERMMTQLVTVVALTRVMRGGAHRSLRSHCMAFDATPGPPATLLPATLDKLSSYRVVVAGSLTSTQIAKIRNLHVVRGAMVHKLLRFYKEHNEFYKSVQIDERCVSSFSDHAVAESVLDFHTSVPPSVVSRVDRDQARVGTESDLSLEDEGELIERSIVFVNEGSADPDKLQSVVELPVPTNSSGRRFLVRNSSKYSRDSQGSIYAKMFPHLFPFGRGHPGDERPIFVSQDACMKYYSMHSSRRFAEDETFLLVAFDRLSTQRMFMQISLTCQRHPEVFRGFDAITHEELSVALRQNELRQQGRLAVTNENPRLPINSSEALR
ncbi:cation-transporting ATPase 13A4 [Phytophthora nicotianae]|uniref:Cation-transporting ATPase 13A4 n=1 Tax=Phytophthora nicotianae TaxID=4792 RepID=A0A0W8DGG4_PHYNI|nr:cation-transporting ATPase 13A4 [Phytophthora nicotianae]